MAERFPVLIASSNAEYRQSFSQWLDQLGYEPVHASSIVESLSSLKKRNISLAILSDALDDATIRDTLLAVRDSNLPTRIVVASRLYTTASYVEAMSLGAYDFIAAPFTRRQLEWIINRVAPVSASPKQVRPLAVAS